MPTRAMWSGDLAFGLLRVPVKLYKGTEDNEIKFNLIHGAEGCNARVRRPMKCENGHDLDTTAEVVKGFTLEDGAVVTFTQAEINDIKVPSSKVIELYRNGEMPDPALFDEVYWIQPELRATHAYSLLVEAMKRKEVSMYGTITIRTKERPVCVWIREGQLVLSTLRYVDDLRAMPDAIPPEALEEEEVKMAIQLLDFMSKDMPVTDSYRTAIKEAAEAKRAGAPVGTIPKAVAVAPVDLMEALRESVARAKAEKTPKRPAAKAKAKAG